MDIQSTSITSAENQVVHKSADSSSLPVLTEKDEPVAVQPHSAVKPRIPGGLAAFHKTRKRKEPPVRITEYPSTEDADTQEPQQCADVRAANDVEHAPLHRWLEAFVERFNDR
ncbi:hypothetical protein TELCIR_04888 [Teladorsagia circumcincta]|uniref:Uncharacterized protein n=1 Tax=Teladorsagia circumcincta TaxID=45464 RepID=A0A2G9USD6_TELCI|nr:hypothetical protein TELCIR_04888 [Teladorsagia circumcincta]